MAWQTPKTNWVAGDIPVADDFNRLEGNIQELQNTKETPAGAQAKADAAETNAKSHANGLVGILSSLATTAKNNIVAAINEIHSWLGQLDNDFDSHKAEDASTTTKGHVQLSSSTSSTSTSLAATASAVKTVNDALTSHQAESAIHKTSDVIRTETNTQLKVEVVSSSVSATPDAGRIIFDTSQGKFFGGNGAEWV